MSENVIQFPNGRQPQDDGRITCPKVVGIIEAQNEALHRTADVLDDAILQTADLINQYRNAHKICKHFEVRSDLAAIYEEVCGYLKCRAWLELQAARRECDLAADAWGSPVPKDGDLSGGAA